MKCAGSSTNTFSGARRDPVALSPAIGPCGFSLAVAPHRLTIEQIIEVFEPAMPAARCLLGNRPCDRDAPCSAHRRWTSITSSYRGALRSTTVAELLGD
jgi:DNA-binding IscR family transcriptional regulator